MKKLFMFALLSAPMLVLASQEGRPFPDVTATPQLQCDGPFCSIKKLEITKSKRDERIYASGNMQLRADVGYELEDGVEVENIELLQSVSRTPIEDLGWAVDKERNEFAGTVPLIGGMDSPSHHFPSSTSSSLKGYEDFYIKTNTIQNIDICVRLTTTTGDTADTCDGTGTSPDITVSSVEPISYSPQDVAIEYKGEHTDTGNGYIMDTYIWQMYLNVPETVNIVRVDPAVVAKGEQTPNEKAFLRLPSSASKKTYFYYLFNGETLRYKTLPTNIVMDSTSQLPSKVKDNNTWKKPAPIRKNLIANVARQNVGRSDIYFWNVKAKTRWGVWKNDWCMRDSNPWGNYIGCSNGAAHGAWLVPELEREIKRETVTFYDVFGNESNFDIKITNAEKGSFEIVGGSDF